MSAQPVAATPAVSPRRFLVTTLRGQRVSLVADTAIQAARRADLAGLLRLAEKAAGAAGERGMAMELGCIIAAADARWGPRVETAVLKVL
jgi:hypothetical protein